MKNIPKLLIGIAAILGFLCVSLPAFASSLPVGVSQFYLAGAGVTGVANTVQLTSMQTPDGRPVTMSMFGTVGYGAIDPQTNAKVEDISFTGITQNLNGTATLTGVTRGLDFVFPYASTGSLQKTHSGGATFIITNTASFYYNEFAMPGNSNVFVYPTASSSVATKGYVDSVAFGNIPSASTIAQGVVQLATGTQIASSTLNGSAGPLVISGNLATSTFNAATAGLKVVVTQNNGKIDNNFISTSTLGLPATTNVQLFTATSGPLTWTKPSGAKSVEVLLIGGGAGGDGGTTGNTNGASGGGGGGKITKIFDASILGSTETVTVGIGGAGGATNSGAGGNGGNTTFGAWLVAGGAARNIGGQGIGIASGLGGGAGGAGSTFGSASAIVGGAGYETGAAGGGGGGTQNSSVVSGAAGGNTASRATPVAGGLPGTTSGASAGATSNVTSGEITGGAGGGGGAGGPTSTTAGNGGNGGLYGGGGGGGGTTAGSGAGGVGGHGADGVAEIITYF